MQRAKKRRIVGTHELSMCHRQAEKEEEIVVDNTPPVRPPIDVFDHSVLIATGRMVSHDIVYEPRHDDMNLPMRGGADPFIGDNRGAVLVLRSSVSWHDMRCCGQHIISPVVHLFGIDSSLICQKKLFMGRS